MPTFHVHPGERLVMTVVVSVPRRARITQLWLGICRNTNWPLDMNPTLASVQRPLMAGAHTFGLHWRVPERRTPAALYLCTSWGTDQPTPVGAARAIAVLAS